MRIKNKYLRNRLFKQKAWNRAKKILEGEFSIKIGCISPYESKMGYTVEYFKKCHRDYIKELSMVFENGCHTGVRHAPKYYKKLLRKKIKAKQKQILIKLLNDEDVSFDPIKRDADWDWF